jgi:23S rRNA pseudouridine1911/1915/1917 synthase
VTDAKVVLIPDGLHGERVDAAMARMLGLSRTWAGELISHGRVRLDGTTVIKSDRVRSGAMLEVELEDRPAATVVPQTVAGVGIVHDDTDIVVVDKPVGVAAHPSLGWDGPDVLSHLAGAGFRISTSGVPERRGIVQRLDVGTSGLMVVAKSEIAYTILKRAFRSRSVEKTYHALVQGHPDPFTGTIDARSDDTPARTGRWRSSTAVGPASPTTRRWTPSSGPACSRSSWRPGGPTRSACTWRPSGIRA